MTDNYKLECRYNYTRMNPSEKELYLFLVERIMKRELRFYYLSVYSYELLYTSENEDIDKTLPVFTYNYDNYIDIDKVYDGLIWDWPELFYIARSELSFERDFLLSIGDGKAEYSDEEIEKITVQLNEISHKFDGIDDEFELELAVRDYIIGDYDYDFDFLSYEGQEERELFTVVGLLKRQKGVCGGLSLLMQYILQQHGILVANIYSDKTEEIDAHAWLIVRINGFCYHVDLTFDEDYSKRIDEPQYMYFNVTDDEIITDHNYDVKQFPDLKCNSTKDNYYYRKGSFFKNTDEVYTALSQFIDDNHNQNGKIPFYFRMQDDMSADIIENAIPKISQKRIKSYTYSHTTDGYFALLFEFTQQ